VNDAHNTSGQAYGLTVLAPIRSGHEAALARYLDLLDGGDDSPLARVPGTHFARWVVIGDVVYEGRRQRRDHLKLGRLLFTSNFDGPVMPYLEALRTGLGDAADSIWDHCDGYPGSADPAAFAAYIRSHQVENSLFFAAYGDLTVDQVKRGLAVRREVIDFATSGQGLGATDLKAAFIERFGR
jgi:hypothetical protein